MDEEEQRLFEKAQEELVKHIIDLGSTIHFTGENGRNWEVNVEAFTSARQPMRVTIWNPETGEAWHSGDLLVRGTLNDFTKAFTQWGRNYNNPVPQEVARRSKTEDYQRFVNDYLKIYDILGDCSQLTAARGRLWNKYKEEKLKQGIKKIELATDKSKSFARALDYALRQHKLEKIQG